MPAKRHDWLLWCFGHLETQQEPVKDEDRPTVGAYDGRVENLTCGQGFPHGKQGFLAGPSSPLRMVERGSSATLVIIRALCPHLDGSRTTSRSTLLTCDFGHGDESVKTQRRR